MLKLKMGAQSRYRVTYLNVPYDCDISFNHIDFYPVDVHCHDSGISIISGWNTPPLMDMSTPSSSLQQSFMPLPLALQETVGNVHFPPDNGVALLSKIKNKSIGIFGASDASLKDDRASHAWIFTSGDIDDISDPMLHVAGSGPVHGYPPYLSSSRGELQGITALAIVTKLFMDFHSFNTPVSVICDNQGVVSKCSTLQHHSLRKQRDVNSDLNLSFRDPSVSKPLALSWVRSHSDKQPWETVQDLKSQRLSRDETYNVWCDRMAQLEWSNGAVSNFEPEVLPSEKWALFSSFPTSHKITGSLDTGFAYAMGYKDLLSYIEEKHSLSSEKIDKVNLFALSTYLLSLSPFQRASMVKTIHDWIPTHSNLCRQGRHNSPICPRCLSEVETPSHV